MQPNNLNNGGTMALAKAGLTAGTTTTYTTTAAIPTILAGAYSTELAAQTNAATPTTDHTTGNAFNALAKSEGCVFVYGIIAAGTIVVSQGAINSLDTDANTFIIDPPFPSIPDTMAPFGYVIVENGSTGSAWTYGADNWTATGVIDTYTDCAFLPDRPQQAT
ncbi:MAG: hypothetical protein COA71_14580 [SAR86 cluster bacterium]|uniref:Uncharacterized protein n=1 Tax=SAR86 cluster bacterium TaxID=2030880 RepID=A0A2A5C5I1_9GAMM|nr:MAG: hypothetical protein COA71_14580 [SAR86 cluster bacterium]